MIFAFHQKILIFLFKFKSLWRLFHIVHVYCPGCLRWSTSYSSCGIRITGNSIRVRSATSSNWAQLLPWAIGAIIASHRLPFKLCLRRVATISTINRKSSKLNSAIRSPTSSTVYSATTAAIHSPIRFAIPGSFGASIVHFPVPTICSASRCSRIKIANSWYSSYLPSAILSVSGTCRRIETVCGTWTNFALRRSNRLTPITFLHKFEYHLDISKNCYVENWTTNDVEWIWRLRLKV